MNPILQNVQVASFYLTWRDPNNCHINLLHPGDQPECSHGNFMGLLPKLQFMGKPDMRPYVRPIVIKATGPHISWMNWTCHSQLIWRLATQIYRNCHRTWLRHHNWWNGDESNFPTLSKNIEQRREVHRIGQQTSISAFLHLRNLMYGGVNQRFPSNGNLNERESQ